MSRPERIRAALRELEAAGVVRDVWAHNANGRKWVFTPAGHSERSLTTSQVEDFILGARAALAAKHA